LTEAYTSTRIIMTIGFDGKRAFQNRTGLGNYIRSLVSILSHHYPQNRYILFAPNKTPLFSPAAFQNVGTVFPPAFTGKFLGGWWRQYGIIRSLRSSGIDIYHGVSNELPKNISKSGLRSVVTIHDIIFERFPETYHLDERFTYRWKIKRACREADAIIAISKQTRDDLVSIYGVDPGKIFICYQSCNPIFQREISARIKAEVKKKYSLPDRYFLFVSSIAPRKNLLGVCKAMALAKDQLDLPLVVIGDGKKEKLEAKAFMQDHGMGSRLVLLNEMTVAKLPAFTTAEDFPAIYQQALALVYPSVFEGFGAPLLEALYSGLPVISSSTSSLPEVAGDAALYFDPQDHKTLAKHMVDIAGNPALVTELRTRGLEQAKKFSSASYAQGIMEVYNIVLEMRKP
jgi:glycosyltransferase involved in cell wall biosynthesis